MISTGFSENKKVFWEGEKKRNEMLFIGTLSSNLSKQHIHNKVAEEERVLRTYFGSFYHTWKTFLASQGDDEKRTKLETLSWNYSESFYFNWYFFNFNITILATEETNLAPFSLSCLVVWTKKFIRLWKTFLIREQELKGTEWKY